MDSFKGLTATVKVEEPDLTPNLHSKAEPPLLPTGKWSKAENELYVEYLKMNMEKLENKTKRRTSKVFLMMAQVVKSRTADQCRGHHRKLIKVCKTIPSIIARFDRKRTSLEEKHREGYSQVKVAVGESGALTLAITLPDGEEIGIW